MHIYREDFTSKLARGRLQEKTGEIQQVDLLSTGEGMRKREEIEQKYKDSQ